MAVKTAIGDFVYLLLDDRFSEPRWREAMVVEIEGEQYKMVVRVTEEESKALSVPPLGDQSKGFFMLVVGSVAQIRRKPGGKWISLKADGKMLLRSYYQIEDNLQFVTASEVENVEGDAEAKVRSLEKQLSELKKFMGSSPKNRKAAEDDDSDSSSSSDGPSSVGNVGMDQKLFADAKKKWLGNSTADDNGVSSSSTQDFSSKKHKLLEKPKKEKKETDFDEMVREMMKAGQKMDFQTLVNLELVKKMRMGGQDNQHGETEGGSGNLVGAGRAVEKWHLSKKAAQKDPVRVIKDYIQEVEAEMGAEDGEAYRLTDFSKKISWGKHRLLGRAHYMELNVLKHLLKKDVEKGALQCVLNLQAYHQAMLDDGSWKVAWMLTHLTDPWKMRRFGGAEKDLELITSYVKSMDDLEKKTKNPWKSDGKNDQAEGEENEQGEDGGPKGRGRGKKKN